MIGSSHVIGKSTFIIDVPSKSLANRVFAVVSRIFQDLLPEPLSVVLDELKTGEQHLSIDRIVVDLGELSEDDLENNLTGILVSALREQLKGQLLKDPYRPVLSELDHIRRFLRYYFSKGIYPWWAGASLVARSPAEWLYEYVQHANSAGKDLLKALLRDPVSRKRLMLLADSSRLNIPELLAGSVDYQLSSDYSVSFQSREEWLWYFLELGRFPAGMTPVSAREVIDLLLQLAREYPEISLARMKEIHHRRPWTLSRISHLAEMADIRELVHLWSGASTTDINNRLIGWQSANLSEKEMWKEVLYWLISEPESVHGRLPELIEGMVVSQIVDVSENLSGGTSRPVESIWFYLESGQYPDRSSARLEDIFQILLREEFHQAPLLSLSRLRGIFRRQPGSLSRLTLMADTDLLRLIFSTVAGIPLAEVEKVAASWRIDRAIEREVWDELLSRFLSESESAGRQRNMYFSSLILSENSARQSSGKDYHTTPAEMIWYYLETGIHSGANILNEQKIHLLKLSERQPVIFLTRLREVNGTARVASDRLIRLLEHKELILLVAALSGTDKRLVESWFDTFPAESGFRKSVRELLEWLLLNPSSRRGKLRDVLFKTQLKLTTAEVSDDEPHPVREEDIWHYLESGKYPSRADMSPEYIKPGEAILRLAVENPVLLLSKLQEIIGRRPEVLIRIISIYSSDQLVRLIRLLSGSSLSLLDSVTKGDELVVREILEAAMRWLIKSKVSGRSRLESRLPDIIRSRIPDTGSTDSDLSDEGLMWYYIEYGMIPTSFQEKTPEYLFGILLDLARRYPALILLRLRELQGRKPWILSRLTLQCSAEYLSQLLFALTGTDLPGRIAEIGVASGMTIPDIQSDYFLWIIGNQSADKDESFRSFMAGLNDQAPEDSPSAEVILWYYLEQWKLPDDLSRGIIRETELLDLLIELSGYYPVHVRFRLKEMAVQHPHVLSGLADRLSSPLLLNLISNLSGVPAGELSGIEEIIPGYGTLRFSVREFRRAILHMLIFENNPMELIRSFIGKWTNNPESTAGFVSLQTEAAFWAQFESGTQVDFSMDQLSYLIRMAESYPGQTIFRLSNVVSFRPSLLSRLAARLDEAGLKRLIAALIKSGYEWLENYQDILRENKIPVKPALWEVLRLAIIYPQTEVKYLNELVPVGSSATEPGREDQLWFYLEHGKFMESAGGAFYMSVGEYLLTMVDSAPLYALSKLKEVARNNRSALNGFLIRQNTDFLELMVVALSGVDTLKLQTAVSPVPYQDLPDSLVRIFWLQALGWLIASPVSVRSDLINYIPVILDQLLPPITSATVSSAFRGYESEYIWKYLGAGILSDAEVTPGTDEINQVIQSYIDEKPTALLYRISALQRADRNFAARFTGNLSPDTLVFVAQKIFGMPDQLLTEMREKLQPDSASDSSWLESLRWIVSDLILRINVGKSSASARKKGGKLSDLVLLWYFLEFGLFPAGMKPSGSYSPGRLLLQALADDPVQSRRQLAELYRTDDMLISRLSQILSVSEIHQLIAALLGMGISEWTSIENKMLPVDTRGDVRLHLWVVLQPLLSASADEIKQIVASIRSQYSENPAVVYPDKPDIWFYLETGLLSGISENIAGRDVARLLIDGVDADELWRRIRNTYQRNRLVLVRLTNLLDNYGIYQVVAHLTGDGAIPWTELEALLEEYGNDEKSSGIILHRALQLLVTRGNRDRKMIVGWIREETGVAAPAIPGGESEPDEPASVWKWLESGRLDKGVSLPSDSDTASFVRMILLDHSGNMARLRELYRTRTGFWVRLIAILGPEDQRNIIAAVLGLDVKAWDVLEEHIMAETGMKSEDVLLTSIRYILNSRSNSGEELLTGLFREAGLSSTSPEVVGKVRSEEYFWSYLEFGRFPVEGKASRREGNQILERGLRSIDGVFIRRLISVFRRDNTMLFRLAIMTSIEWRRKLLINILKTDISGLSHAERMWSASFRKMTREDIVSAMLRLTFSGNADSPDGLIAALEKESGISAVNKTTASETSLEEPEEKPGIADSHPVETGIISSYEYLLWYFLEQGRYPPGVKAVANEAVVTQFMKLLNSDISAVRLRLRELYRFHPALLIHITNILSPSQLRQLVASIAGETEEEWMIQEDIIRSGTIAEHHTVRFQITALGFLLSGAAKDMKSLAGLMSARMGLEEPVDMVRSVEYSAGYAIWYYLEYGYHPPGTSPVSPDQFYAVLREMASKQATMVQERMRQIYRRTPAIIARINRVFDSSRLQGFISVALNLGSVDWKEARQLFELSRTAVYPGYDNLYSFILKWWLTGEINDGETLIQVLGDLSPDPTRKSASMGSSSSRQSALWFYLEKGYYPADSVMLTDAELGDEILSAVSRDREDTLYRLRDLFRRNPVLLLLTSRLGNQAISSTIVKLIDISAEKLTQIVVSLQNTLDSGDSDNDLAYAYVWRMILSGEAGNQSDLERLADRKEIRVNQADISPIYQVWYYLDQGKILAGSVSQNQMAMVLLEAAAAERAATVRQLRDLNSHSKGVFVRLLGLLSADNLKRLVQTLLDLGEENWQQLLELPAIPDEERILTDLLRGMLRGRLSDKTQVVDYLQQMPEYATGEVLSPVSVYESEMLMWYYLDSGKYPPGALPQSDEELGDMMMRAAVRESRETLLRLRELYKRRSGLLLTLSRILSEESRRKLVARLSELTDTEWSRIEDVLQINTEQSPGKILNDTIRYLITGSGEINQSILSGLPGLIAQTTVANTQMSEEEYLWYFLEHGRLFDRYSPDVARLGEKIVSLWRVSPGRIAARWKVVSSRTNIENRLRQYYSRQILEQIVRARYEVVQIDPDLMIADLLTFPSPRGRKINTEQMWDFMIEILLPELHIVKNSYAVFEELLDLLSAHYRIKPGKIARFLKDHPPVSQAGQKYALRASFTATSSEITMLTEMIAAQPETFPAKTDFRGNIYITVLTAELQKVRELLSGALRWSDWPDAAGTIVWLLKTGRQPTLALIRKMLRDEWVISNLDRSVPLETVEIIQEALASGLWHKILSVRDESIYYFDLLLQERLISHFNEVFFRVAAVTEPSVDKVAGLFLDRIIIQEGVTSRDLTGALRGKSSVGQGALLGYIRRKYARQGGSVKPVLELVREASTRVDEAIFVSNAGLVILHPYLSRYFGMLGLLDGKEFRDEEAAIRAVHLLQYLATRQTETPEYLLVLNKILCGLPVDMPVTPGIVMTDQEVELSESLLKGVLQNWKRMENSTIDNLSGAFLVREGRLMERADRWTLHVKSRAYDILLEFMPWGFSRIKLSWMTKRMDVEWKTKA